MSLGRLTRAGALAAVAAVAAAASALPAPALGASGSATLRLDGPAAAALRASGVQIAPLAPARGGAHRVVLPVGAGLAGKARSLVRQRGAIRLSLGKRAVRLGALTLSLGKRSRLRARVGGDNLDFFRLVGGTRKVDALAGTLRTSGLRLVLTAAGAQLLVDRLGLERLRPRAFGTLTTNARGLTPGGKPKGGGGGSTACPLPSTGGAEPETPLPTLVRPAGAVEVLSASIDWHVRESFIRYIATGEGTSVSGGATADPPVLMPGTSTPLSYVFHFPFSSGWLSKGANATDPADDMAEISYSGALRFRYSGHEIDLTAAEPEIELNGARSRAIFWVASDGGTNERQVLVNLDLTRAAKISAAGTSYVYERVPGAIPSGTSTSTFAGFYAPGTEFGCFTVSFTTAG